jgi:nucleolar protein 12
MLTILQSENSRASTIKSTKPPSIKNRYGNDESNITSKHIDDGGLPEGYEANSDTKSQKTEKIADEKTVSEDEAQSDGLVEEESLRTPRRSRKRKHDDEEDDIEAAYMRKLARQEQREHVLKAEKSRSQSHQQQGGIIENELSNERVGVQEEDANAASPTNSDADELDIPTHESMNVSKEDQDFEKASRTVFLGNVSSEVVSSKAAKKALLRHLSSFIKDLPKQAQTHRVESIRFRSTAFDPTIPKKAAFAKKELVESTTKSTNAYAVYSTSIAAREAVKRLNGTVILDRHLRVDLVAHPSKIDHRRCVFVGNLGYVDDDTAIREANNEKSGQKTKHREPADVEEGLWRQFAKAGDIESVRVVRDAKTRVGKGFAYVQFKVGVVEILCPIIRHVLDAVRRCVLTVLDRTKMASRQPCYLTTRNSLRYYLVVFASCEQSQLRLKRTDR